MVTDTTTTKNITYMVVLQYYDCYTISYSMTYNQANYLLTIVGRLNPKNTTITPVTIYMRYMNVYIAVTSHKSHCVSNHRDIECLLNSLYRLRLATENIWKLCIAAALWEQSTVIGWLPAQRAKNMWRFIMWWRQHGVCIIWSCLITAYMVPAEAMSILEGQMDVLY